MKKMYAFLFFGSLAVCLPTAWGQNLICPQQPGYVECPSSLLTVYPLPVGWQYSANVNSNVECGLSGKIFFTFSAATFSKASNNLQCKYVAANKSGMNLGNLTISTPGFKYDNTAKGNQWQETSEGYECKQTAITNCTIQANY